MRRWAQAAAPLLLLLITGTTTDHPAMADDGQILFVKGRIADAEYLDGFIPSAPSGNAPFIEGGDYRVNLAITEVLIGQPRQSNLHLTLTITDAPHGDPHPEIFLLVEQLPAGQFQPIDWDFAANGVCMGEETSRQYGIEKAIRDIQKKYPCK
ncbi:MAG TPA: hypothetical protein VGT78_12015 [Rhizomicrobium sp.]|nr:hypothetical protein [Rhizomicrobium sp.]